MKILQPLTQILKRKIYNFYRLYFDVPINIIIYILRSIDI